jgi:hypothetical protein
MFDQKIVKFPDMKFENKEDVVAYLADFLYEENKISEQKRIYKSSDEKGSCDANRDWIFHCNTTWRK